MARTTKAEREEAVARLKTFVSEGDTLHLILRHRSRSGMQRRISVLKIQTTEDGGIETYQLDRLVALALGWSVKDGYEGVVVDGCGMDMGFHLVYELAGVLFEDTGSLKRVWL